MSVKYLPQDDIEAETIEVLKRHSRYSTYPVDIEMMIESDMGIVITPVLDLMDKFGIDGFTLGDASEIIIDHDIYMDMENRARFTLAHEVGHIRMHLDHLRYAASFRAPNAVEQWVEFYTSMDTEDHYRYEQQGYIFGGLLLVPTVHLESEFERELPHIERLVTAAKERCLPREHYLERAVEALARKMSPAFSVSAATMGKRLKNSGLIDRIP